MKKRAFVLIMLPVLCAYVHGDETAAYRHSEVKKTTVSKNKVASIAQLWGISKTEAMRYQEIMEGPLGKWNPNIDPIMALGIYAETEVDRQHYAELYALQEFKLTDMAQQFGRAYDKAFKGLFPDAKTIDPTLLTDYYEGQTEDDIFGRHASETVLQQGDRLLYFADIDCSHCKPDLASLERTIAEHASRFIGVGVDVYIVDAKKEDDVRRWAKRNGVNTDLVKNASMTLNLDSGLQQKLNTASQEQARLYLLRNDKTFIVNPAQIGMTL